MYTAYSLLVDHRLLLIFIPIQSLAHSTCIIRFFCTCIYVAIYLPLSSYVRIQIGSLQMKIVAEDKVVEQKTQELLQEWEKGKPVQVGGTHW